MKRLMTSACLAVIAASSGCCCFPFCGGGYGGGCGYGAPAANPCNPCSPCSPYGAGYGSASLGAPQTAYYGGAYPMTAAAPIDIMPNY